jgi:hypothetical protein
LKGASSPTYSDSIPYPSDGKWHFVRMVHTNGKLATCIDGIRVSSFDLPAGNLDSMFPVYLGRNGEWEPSPPDFSGRLDDVRVIDGALPCEEMN